MTDLPHTMALLDRWSQEKILRLYTRSAELLLDNSPRTEQIALNTEIVLKCGLYEGKRYEVTVMLLRTEIPIETDEHGEPTIGFLQFDEHDFLVKLLVQAGIYDRLWSALVEVGSRFCVTFASM
jgi:hypothetical protein